MIPGAIGFSSFILSQSGQVVDEELPDGEGRVAFYKAVEEGVDEYEFRSFLEEILGMAR